MLMRKNETMGPFPPGALVYRALPLWNGFWEDTMATTCIVDSTAKGMNLRGLN